MKRSNTGFGVNLRSLVVVMVVMTLGFSLMPTYRAEAHWSGASFLGGMVAGHMVSRIGYNMRGTDTGGRVRCLRAAAGRCANRCLSSGPCRRPGAGCSDDAGTKT